MKKTISVLTTLVMVIMLVTFVGAAETWVGVAGTWVQSGSDMTAASGSQDYYKLASTTNSIPADFKISGQIMVLPSAMGGTGTYLILRHTGETALDNATGPNATCIVFNFNFGHVRIMSGMTVLSTAVEDEVASGEYILNLYDATAGDTYIDFSIEVEGDKITEMIISGNDVTDHVQYITLPITTAGAVSVASFTNPPTLEMGIKNVVISTGDEPAATATPEPQETQAPGDISNIAVFVLPAILSLGAIAFGKKR